MDKRFAIGNFICELRQEKGLTQKELGDMLGVTNKAVSKWENGASMPRMEYLHDLSAILGCTEEELFLGRRIDKDKEGHSASTEESYISVVQRCNSCDHEGNNPSKKIFYCKKCGAKITPYPAWKAAIIIAYVSVFVIASSFMWFAAYYLRIDYFFAGGFPTKEEALFFKQIHEELPHIELIGIFAMAFIYISFCAAELAILRLLSFLLRKKIKYQILGYPHSEDGKIVF